MVNTGPAHQRFIKLIRNSWRFRLFLLAKLPMAWLAGCRIRHLDESTAMVSVPYKYLTKNPFRSTYFACLAMAAEMSTGLLAYMYLYRASPSVSMLATGMEAEFVKKATGHTTFRCEDGEAILQAIVAAQETGQPQEVVAVSTGTDSSGNTVAVFRVKWSFKARV
jgi:hypothetical protein